MKDISNIRLTTQTEWVVYDTLTDRDTALRVAQKAHNVEGFPAAYVQEISSRHFEVMVLEDRAMEPGKISHGFKKILETNKADNSIPAANYCQNCYRRNLTPEQIACVSHGEIYCKFCASH